MTNIRPSNNSSVSFRRQRLLPRDQRLGREGWPSPDPCMRSAFFPPADPTTPPASRNVIGQCKGFRSHCQWPALSRKHSTRAFLSSFTSLSLELASLPYTLSSFTSIQLEHVLITLLPHNFTPSNPFANIVYRSPSYLPQHLSIMYPLDFNGFSDSPVIIISPHQHQFDPISRAAHFLHQPKPRPVMDSRPYDKPLPVAVSTKRSAENMDDESPPPPPAPPSTSLQNQSQMPIPQGDAFFAEALSNTLIDSNLAKIIADTKAKELSRYGCIDSKSDDHALRNAEANSTKLNIGPTSVLAPQTRIKSIHVRSHVTKQPTTLIVRLAPPCSKMTVTTIATPRPSVSAGEVFQTTLSMQQPSEALKRPSNGCIST